ncbi:MAG: hypothetical protein HY781_01900 [Chloroflexi bacterium]|nr:hypothetical protein [Chloroflexota bacterium]
MTRRDYVLLSLLGLAAVLAVAAFQSVPGYMDADYYYAGGLQLAAGHGFTEPYLWNYLDDPAGLPHPSHAYWMPLASILAAIVPSFFGPGSWFAARIPFYLAVACLPPLTAALAFSLTARRSLALTSGLLAVFSGFYLPFLATTDTFALYMLFGGLFFLISKRQYVNLKASITNSFLLGLLAGLMHLSRADGLLWLFLAFITSLFSRKSGQSLLSTLCSILSVFTGYLLIMAPWFARNYAAFGSFLAPGGSKLLWLTAYDEIFAYPASQLTFQHWWDSGLAKILAARSWSFGMNFATLFSVQGGIFLLPLILIGIWNLRKDRRVQLAPLAWLLTFTAMTVAFPFAGARGGFFHSGAAVQTVWWALAPIGLERVIQWGRKRRGWNEVQARPVFLGGLVGMAALFSILVLALRIPTWGQESSLYSGLNDYLEAGGMSAEAVVIVSNPPGFYLVSGNPAIAIPDGNSEIILELAQHYGAEYLILEAGSTPVNLLPVYENPQDYPGLNYLGELEGARVFAIQP